MNTTIRDEIARRYLNGETMASLASSCAICAATEQSSGYNFLLDHDHHTGEPRGYLCARCNTMVGRIESGQSWPDRTLVVKAQAYLANPPARQILAQPRSA